MAPLIAAFLADYSNTELGVRSTITIGKKGYELRLYDTDANEMVTLKYYPLDKFNFSYVDTEALRMIN